MFKSKSNLIIFLLVFLIQCVLMAVLYEQTAYFSAVFVVTFLSVLATDVIVFLVMPHLFATIGADGVMYAKWASSFLAIINLIVVLVFNIFFKSYLKYFAATELVIFLVFILFIYILYHNLKTIFKK